MSRLAQAQAAHDAAARRIAEWFVARADSMSEFQRLEVISDLLEIADEDAFGDLLDRIESGAP